MNMQAMEARDKFNQVKALYFQGKASREEVEAAATVVLTNLQAAEKKLTGRVKTQINALAIAKLLR